MVLLHSRESDRQREANKGRDTFLSFNRTTEDITKGFNGLISVTIKSYHNNNQVFGCMKMFYAVKSSFIIIKQILH